MPRNEKRSRTSGPEGVARTLGRPRKAWSSQGRLPVGLRIRGLVHIGRSFGQNAFSGCFVSFRTYRGSSGSARVVAGKALSVIENRPDTLA